MHDGIHWGSPVVDDVGYMVDRFFLLEGLM